MFKASSASSFFAFWIAFLTVRGLVLGLVDLDFVREGDREGIGVVGFVTFFSMIVVVAMASPSESVPNPPLWPTAGIAGVVWSSPLEAPK